MNKLYSMLLFAKFSVFPPRLNDYNPTLTREELIRRSRILVVDDETPPLIGELQKEGFAVDHDPLGSDMTKVLKGLYTLVILDYGNVGLTYGKQQGLDYLRELKRCNPACYVIAYTSKSLKTHQSDFYRLADATLSKDAAWGETLEVIETSLRNAFDVVRLWNAVLSLSGASERDKKSLERQLAIALETRQNDSLMENLGRIVGSSVTDSLIGHVTKTLFALGTKGISGGL